MTVLDVSAAIDSRDCDWPGCDRESERDGRCRYHAGRTHAGQRTDDDNGRVIPGALAHLLNDDPEPKETPVSACKIDGCTEAGLDKRGPYTGLCSAHKREKAAAIGAARRTTVKPPPADGQTARTPAAPVAAKPVAAATSNGHQELTLVQLAQAVEDTRVAAANAIEAHYAAKETLARQLDALDLMIA